MVISQENAQRTVSADHTGSDRCVETEPVRPRPAGASHLLGKRKSGKAEAEEDPEESELRKKGRREGQLAEEKVGIQYNTQYVVQRWSPKDPDVIKWQKTKQIERNGGALC